MYRVIVVDDEALVLDSMRYVLKKFEQFQLVGEYTDPEKALAQLPETRPELIFADITMPRISGLEFAESVHRALPGARIVFVTAYEQYAVDAFGVNAFDYLLKPITTSKIQRIVNKLDQKPAGEERQGGGAQRALRIPASLDNHIYLIDPADASYIMIERRNLYIVTPKGQYLIRESIGYWEEALAPHGWFRCHRCFLINLNQVEMVSTMFNATYSVKLRDIKEEIVVSRTYVNAFRAYFNL